MTRKKLSSYTTIAASLLLAPLLSFAQFTETGGTNELNDFGLRIITFINDTLVPFVFSVALLLFIWGVYVYFIQGADDTNKQKEGRNYIIWAIIAFVVMVSVWGITNLIAGGLGLNDPNAIEDLIPEGVDIRG